MVWDKAARALRCIFLDTPGLLEKMLVHVMKPWGSGGLAPCKPGIRWFRLGGEGGGEVTSLQAEMLLVRFPMMSLI
jgi:hypothetical protein